MPVPLLEAIIVSLVLYPGILFALVAGSGLVSLRRAVLAKAEGRRQPPLLQPFYDTAKLFSKQILAPDHSSALAGILLPVGALAACSIAMVLLPLPGNPLPAILSPATGAPFRSDAVLVVLLLEVPVLSAVASGAMSGSAYAWVSATRRAALSIISTLPYLFAVMALIIAAASLDLRQIGWGNGWGVTAVKVGAIAVLMLCLPGKLAAPPFSGSEAELEISGGITIEYSGLTLLLMKVAKSMHTIALVSFVFVLAVPLSGNSPVALGAYLATLAGAGLVLSLVEARTGRMRFRHARQFYLVYVLPLSLATLAFALYVSNWP